MRIKQLDRKSYNPRWLLEKKKDREEEEEKREKEDLRGKADITEEEWERER